MTKPQAVNAAVLVFIAAIIAVLTTSHAVDWSGAQIALVTVTAESAGALVLAIGWHVAPGTAKEPVAIGGALVVFVTSAFYLADGFGWTHFGDTVILAIGGAITSGVSVITVIFARASVKAAVTPSIE